LVIYNGLCLFSASLGEPSASSAIFFLLVWVRRKAPCAAPSGLKKKIAEEAEGSPRLAEKKDKADIF
jgi:hypothetical protein